MPLRYSHLHSCQTVYSVDCQGEKPDGHDVSALFLTVVIYHLITELCLKTKVWKKMKKLMKRQDDVSAIINDNSDQSEPMISVMDGPSCEHSFMLMVNEIEKPLLVEQ